jgi:hypothetical protein
MTVEQSHFEQFTPTLQKEIFGNGILTKCAQLEIYKLRFIELTKTNADK